MATDIFHRIESPKFSACVNVVSGFKQFLKAIDAQPEVKQLREDTPDTATAIDLLYRVYKLTEPSNGDEFENPADAALAVYLRVLNDVNPGLAWLAAKRVKECPNLWWARQVAETIRPVDRFRAVHTVTMSVEMDRGVPWVQVPTTHDVDIICLSLLEPPARFVQDNLRSTTIMKPDEICFGVTDMSSSSTRTMFRNTGASNRTATFREELVG